MSSELTTEEKRRMVESLASEHGIPEDKAEACLVATDWDVEGAGRIATLNTVDHLLINLRFFGKNPLTHSGLISILLKREVEQPEHIIGLTRDGHEFIDEVSPFYPAPDFMKAILSPPRQVRGNSTWLSLQQSIIYVFNGDSIEEFFSIGDEKVAEFDADGRLQEHTPLKDAVVQLIKPVIDDLFMESTRLEVSTEFLNGFQYNNLKQVPQEKAAEPEQEQPTKQAETFKIYLTGRLIIDPHRGVPVEDLEENDTIVIYNKGVWFPAKGKIVSIEDGLMGAKKIIIRSGPGIYIITSALHSVRVKVSEDEMDSILRRIEHNRDESVRSALGILPIALIILGVALALTILLQRG